MEIQNALITGPTGTIGTAIIRELLRNGAAVTALVRPESPLIKNLPVSENLSVVPADLSALSELTGKTEGAFDAFFHLGWAGTYGAARKDREMQEKNVKYTLDAVELAASVQAKAFIFAGSQSEFGPVSGRLTPETPCHPDNPYGEAKLLAERAAAEKCREKGIRFEACRIVSTYGPCDKEYTMVMSTLLKMRRGERLSFTKGEQIWDYLYSDDAASAFVKAAEKGKDGSIYLVASGASRPLKDFITEMRDTAAPGAPLYFGEVPYYENQVMRLEADIKNLQEDTGFAPKVSFKEGIRRTLQWIETKE